MKNVTLNLLTIVSLFLGASAAQASGFRCEGGDGFAVKLFNHTNATRTPAKLIVSHGDADPSTLLVRSDEEISKSNRLSTVRYTVDGNAKIGAETVILQINFKEGSEVLEAGEVVPGQLILIDENGHRDVTALECERYLKGA